MIYLIIYVLGWFVFFLCSGFFVLKINDRPFEYVENGILATSLSFIWPIVVVLFGLAWLRAGFLSLVENYMDKKEREFAAKETKKLQLAKEQAQRNSIIEPPSGPNYYPPLIPETNYREMNCKECGSEIGDRGKVKIVPLQEALKLPKVKSNE